MISFVKHNFIGENLPAGKKHKCNICGRDIDAFISGGRDYGIFRAHHILGGGARENNLFWSGVPWKTFWTRLKEKIESYRFKVRVISPKDTYNHEQIEYYDVIEDDVILICEQ